MDGHYDQHQAAERRLNDFLGRLSDELGRDWKRIARRLGCTEGDIYHLEEDYRNDARERAYQMLLRNSRAIVRAQLEEKLREAFQDAERQDLVGLLTNFPDISDQRQPQNVRGLDKDALIEKLKKFVRSKMSKLPLIPWITTGYVHVDQVFTNVQLLISVATAYLPVRLKLKSHNAIFTDLTEENEGLTEDCSTRVLVRGRTGSGKTTLLTKYAYDWSVGKEGALLRDVPVVLILPMRKLDQHSDLGDAVLGHMLPRERQITAADIEDFCLDHPEDVVILLDGYDEFKGKGLDHDDCGNIVKMLRGDCFADTRVVVTSRPSRVDDFQDDYYDYRHIEVTGFTSEDIDNYVHKVFKGENEPLGDKLLDYLEENQLKEELASIPLMLTAFCQLTKWTDGRDFGELNTVGKLFDRLIECVFTHDKTKTAAKRGSARKASNSSASDDLVLELGKVALEGLFGSDVEELIFSEDDFSRCTDPKLVIDQGLRAGFLCRDGESSFQPQSYEGLGLKGQNPPPLRNISFILKSLQEKCAGNYLAHLVDEDDELTFTTYLQRVGTHQRILDLTNVLVFASGVSMRAASLIISHVVKLLVDQQGQNIAKYLEGKLHFQDCQKTQRLIEICLQLNFESKGEGRFNHLFNDLFGDGSVVRLVGISSYVAKALGYLFNHSGQQPSTSDSTTTDHLPPDVSQVLSIQRLELNCNRLNSSTEFREFLNCYPGAENEITKFMANSVSNQKLPKLGEKFSTGEEEKVLKYVTDRPDTTYFAVVPIWQEINRRKVYDFSLSFVLAGVKKCLLQDLSLIGVRADDKDWQQLISLINDSVFLRLTKLTLSLNDLQYEQTAPLAASLNSTPELKYLKVAGNQIGESFVEDLPAMKCLENVILENNNMSSGAMVAFMKKLELYPRLNKLDLRRNQGSDDAFIRAICNQLSDQRPMTELRLSLHTVTEDGLAKFSSRIGVVAAGLTHLNLVHTPIPDRVIYHAALALASLSHLLDLRISGKSSPNPGEDSMCTSDTVDVFTTELDKLEEITFLSILYTKMLPDDFLKMVSCCGKHKSLKTFRFSRSCLPEDEEVKKVSKEAEKTFLSLWV